MNKYRVDFYPSAFSACLMLRLYVNATNENDARNKAYNRIRNGKIKTLDFCSYAEVNEVRC